MVKSELEWELKNVNTYKHKTKGETTVYENFINFDRELLINMIMNQTIKSWSYDDTKEIETFILNNGGRIEHTIGEIETWVEYNEYNHAIHGKTIENDIKHEWYSYCTYYDNHVDVYTKIPKLKTEKYILDGVEMYFKVYNPMNGNAMSVRTSEYEDIFDNIGRRIYRVYTNGKREWYDNDELLYEEEPDVSDSVSE